jgi:hypothetical protein
MPRENRLSHVDSCWNDGRGRVCRQAENETSRAASLANDVTGEGENTLDRREIAAGLPSVVHSLIVIDHSTTRFVKSQNNEVVGDGGEYRNEPPGANAARPIRSTSLPAPCDLLPDQRDPPEEPLDRGSAPVLSQATHFAQAATRAERT